MPSKLTPEDQQKVDIYLNRPQHQVERRPFRPIWLLLMTIAVVVLLGLLSRLLGKLVA